MKKIGLICLILVLGFSAFAGNMYVGISNDMWSNGISENYDDQLSFALLSELLYKDFNISLEDSAYTNRGWKDSPDGDFYSGRLDILDAAIGYTFKLTDKISLRPEIGFSLTGDLGLANAQNIIHRVVNLNPVNLTYDSIFKTHLLANIDVSFTQSLLKFGKTNLNFTADASFKNRIGIDYKQQYNVGLHFGPLFTSLGTQNVSTVTDSKTVKLANKYFQGLVWKAGVKTKLLSLTYNYYPSKGYGATDMVFDLFKIEDIFGSSSSILWMQLGTCRLMKRDYYENKFGLNIRPHVAVVYTNRYATGYDILNANEKDTSVRYQRNYKFSLLGLRLSKDIKPMISAYGEASVGFSSWKLAYLYNMDENATSMKTSKDTKRYVCADAQIGVTILPAKNYGLSLFAGSVVINDNHQLNDLFKKDNSNNKFDTATTYIGLGVDINLNF